MIQGDYQGDILIVDDTPNNLRILSAALTEQGYKVRSVTSGQMALTVAEAAQPDLILLDIRMPEMDGYETCQRLKAQGVTAGIPVIFLSALDEVLDKVQAFSVGGVDYITKPFQLEEVLIRVENQLGLLRARREIQRLNESLEHRVRQRTAQLESEIAERQKAQEQLLHVALHDVLTGLPNRTWFMKRLDQALMRTRQHRDYTFAVMLLDCDRFKIVNDSLGHLVGDQLLIAIARRIESCLSPRATLARLGGDEFLLLLEDTLDIQEATRMADQIHRELQLPFQLGQFEAFTNVSVGIVLGNHTYEQPEHLLRDADTAMYQAKALGKAGYQVFDASLHHRAMNRMRMETDLRRAITREEFEVYYQPIVSLADCKIVGFESLVRWHHPVQGWLSPDHFIASAEEAGLVVDIDMWVLQQASRQLAAWQKQNIADADLGIAINLSVQNFAKPNLIRTIDAVLNETGISGRSLKLEITESGIMKNADYALVILEQIKARQIEISIDDFGTGYSSLSYLDRFPVDFLKIDRSFMPQRQDNTQNVQIIRAILALSDSLSMAAIAEGIETESQLQLLKCLGCEFGQGYYFSRPLTATAAALLLKGTETLSLLDIR